MRAIFALSGKDSRTVKRGQPTLFLYFSHVFTFQKPSDTFHCRFLLKYLSPFFPPPPLTPYKALHGPVVVKYMKKLRGSVFTTVLIFKRKSCKGCRWRSLLISPVNHELFWNGVSVLFMWFLLFSLMSTFCHCKSYSNYKIFTV